MIREHIGHIHRAIDDQTIPTRAAVTLVTLLSLPALWTAVRAIGGALDLGQLVHPLLVSAHVPVVVALAAVWSIGCEVCRTEGSA